MGPPRPLVSPGAPQNGLDPEPGTGEHPVTRNDFRRSKRQTDLKGLALLVSVATAAFGGYHALAADIQDKVDAGLTLVNQKHDGFVEETRSRSAAQEKRLDRVESKVDRVDQKIDAVLDAMHVPASKRPLKDGGP